MSAFSEYLCDQQQPWISLQSGFGYAAGRVHAKRMKSFLRYLVTENAAQYEAPVAANDNSPDGQYQEALLDSSSIKELPDTLVSLYAPA